MIKVAHIVSLFHLDLLRQNAIRMAIAPLVLANSEYAGYFRRGCTDGCYTILDNGAYESGGTPVTHRQLLDAAELVEPNEIVCPDVMHDGPATADLTRQFLGILAEEGLRDRYALMGVPHGSSLEEWMRSFQVLNAMKEISVIGLSRLSVRRSWGAYGAFPRVTCAKALLPLLGVGKALHLLGGDHNFPQELRLLADEPRVRSADSSFAFKYSVAAIPIAGDILSAKVDVRPPLFEHDRIDNSATLARVARLSQLLDDCARGGVDLDLQGV